MHGREMNFRFPTSTGRRKRHRLGQRLGPFGLAEATTYLSDPVIAFSSLQSPIGFSPHRGQGVFLAPLGRHLAVRMKFGEANIALVGQTQGLGSKSRAALFEAAEIVYSPRSKGGGKDDFAFPAHDHLRFCVCHFFLPL